MVARGVFGFPNPVNEKAARVVAGGVLVIALLTLALGLTFGSGGLWPVAALALGFLLRVLAGPTLSPLGRVATRVVAPRLGPARLVPGPPKRFAQAIGLVVTGAGTVALALGHPALTVGAVAMIVVAAGLESLAGFCLGCTLFAALMQVGVIPESTCVACSNVGLARSARR